MQKGAEFFARTAKLTDSQQDSGIVDAGEESGLPAFGALVDIEPGQDVIGH
jgi:hypothetical protein